MRTALASAIGVLIITGGLGVRGSAATAHLRPGVALSHSPCAGHERWKIKTLTDEQAGEVSKTAKTTTVAELRANDTRPAKVSAKVERIHPVEFRRYRVHATLRKALVKFELHATITGVGFWDLKHGNPQLGRAPNDIELHRPENYYPPLEM